MAKRSVVKQFKLMMLIHKLIFEESIPESAAEKLLLSIIFKPKNPFEVSMVGRLLDRYRHYLLKRNMSDLPYSRQAFPHNDNVAYKIMNLLNTASSFNSFIFILGRYYSRIMPFAIDFNLVLGEDLRNLYQLMARNISRPINRSTY